MREDEDGMKFWGIREPFVVRAGLARLGSSLWIPSVADMPIARPAWIMCCVILVVDFGGLIKYRVDN